MAAAALPAAAVVDPDPAICRLPWCRVILVEPRDARNVGMVARACANFGVSDLAVVHAGKLQAALDRAGRSPEKARQLGFSDAPSEAVPNAELHCALDVSAWKGVERLATGEGGVVLQSARLYGGLRAALAGTGRSVAFSGREGRNFRQASVSLRALACDMGVSASAAVTRALEALEAHPPQRVALVFGSEDVGLSTEAVLMCDDVCRLRTADCPSLNLSHTVAVVLARVHEEVSEAEGFSGPAVAPAAGQPAAVAKRSSAPLPAEDVRQGREADAAAEASEVGVQVPAAWTSGWSELCRRQFEAQGYPTQAELWNGRGRRKCKFTYRLFRIVADCARSLQRARVTEHEATAWAKLVEALSTRSTAIGPDASAETVAAETADSEGGDSDGHA
ncbi:unnamed protein product [Polarella glacialis]|uniref:tRNA/rRNA methyltransferase SpoU type domain-containing protein n=1 Tax=Polarella glacialis TaxID=89957 RepID=A0A813FYL5_POLGL|nr:unnamed protein product [Polarella glacialis]